MGSTKIESRRNIGDDEIQYQLKIDTGHVENTDTPNRVPYTFPISEGYILKKLKFNKSSRVGNCYINYTIENNTIRLEAVAHAVRDASRLFYKAGGHLKGTAILTFQKIKPETEEINYEFNIDTGHVENTDTPNCVSYSFPIDFHLLKQSYTVSQFEFSESSRVGNCFIHPTIEKGVIKIEAVAQAVKASSGLWYQAGGHLKGTVRVTLRKTEYVGIQSKHEASQTTIKVNMVNGDQVNVSGDVRSDNINLGEFTGNVSTSIEKPTYQTNQGDLIMSNDNRIQGIGEMSGGTIQGNAKVAGILNEAEQRNLAEAAAEIQQLLEQLDKSYPSDTMSGRMQIATEAVSQIENNPAFKTRVLSALKAGGVSAFEQFLNHPAASFVIGALEDWQKTKED
ncbi:MAG: hypothetical protein WBB43_20440 [Limnoraphis sp.]